MEARLRPSLMDPEYRAFQSSTPTGILATRKEAVKQAEYTIALKMFGLVKAAETWRNRQEFSYTICPNPEEPERIESKTAKIPWQDNSTAFGENYSFAYHTIDENGHNTRFIVSSWKKGELTVKEYQGNGDPNQYEYKRNVSIEYDTLAIDNLSDFLHSRASISFEPKNEKESEGTDAINTCCIKPDRNEPEISVKLAKLHHQQKDPILEAKRVINLLLKSELLGRWNETKGKLEKEIPVNIRLSPNKPVEVKTPEFAEYYDPRYCEVKSEQFIG